MNKKEKPISELIAGEKDTFCVFVNVGGVPSEYISRASLAIQQFLTNLYHKEHIKSRAYGRYSVKRSSRHIIHTLEELDEDRKIGKLYLVEFINGTRI